MAKSGAAAGGRSKKTHSTRDASAAPLKRPYSAASKPEAPNHAIPYKKSEAGGGASQRKAGGKGKHSHADGGNAAGGDGENEKPRLDGVVKLKFSSSDDATAVVDFGPDDKSATDPGGRRAKKEREMKKKMKAGSFGKFFFFSLSSTSTSAISVSHLDEKPENEKKKQKP